MKRLNQLFAAGLLLATSQFATAQSTNFSPIAVAMEEKQASKADLLLLDKNPNYKLWQNEYRLDKVEYRTDATVFHFRYVGGQYSYIMLYAPNGSHPWLLRDDATGREFAMKGVYNVRQNGRLVDDQIETDMLSLGSDGGNKMIVTCEVHFAPLPKSVKSVDLIEGRGTDTYSNHFHVLDIKMKAPKVAVEIPAEEVVVVEEQVVDAKPVVNKATQLVDVPGIECTVFPNPSTEIVNVQLTDIEEARMQLFSSNGQVLWSNLVKNSATTINVSEFPAGAYFLHITVDGKTAVKSIIVE